MIFKSKSIMEIIVFTMIIIGAILNKSQSLETLGIEGSVHPRGCYPHVTCTNILEEECWNKIATFICCDEDQADVHLKITSCCVDIKCNFHTKRCFNNLLVADLLKDRRILAIIQIHQRLKRELIMFGSVVITSTEVKSHYNISRTM